MTPELAEVCGIHAGDGYMRLRYGNKGEFTVSGHKEEKGYYDNHVIPLVNIVFELDIIGRFFHKGNYGFVTYVKRAHQMLHSLGFPYKKKSLIVSVPETILNSSDNSVKCAFLRGLFDTDGCLTFRKSYYGLNKFKKTYTHYPKILISTVSKSLARGILKILHDLDIVFNYYITDPKRKRDNRKYIISISGVGGLDSWMRLVGMKNPVKHTRYLIWKKFGFCPTNTTLEQREKILKGSLNIYSL